MKKIYTDQEAEAVFVSGMFNILHPGHFRFLKFAAERGDRLIVGVLSNRLAPLVTVDEKERLANIGDLAFVDETFVLDEPPEDYIARIKPAVVVKGWEFHDADNPEAAIIESYGGKLIFSSGDIKFASSGQSGDTLSLALKTIVKPQGFLQRHRFALQDLNGLLKKFDGLRVCVLGDLIADHYIKCDPVGMSREDPTIVVRPVHGEYFLGGAGIVAAHAAGLGARVNFISVCGADDAGKFCRQRLEDYGVKAHLIEDSSRPTTQKNRYRAAGKTLLRVNDYADHPVSKHIHTQIMEKLRALMTEIDVVIFSDFSYGALPQEMVNEITALARERSIVIAADSQTSSQVGNVARFKHVSLVTPTEHEARMAINNYSDGLVKLAERIMDATHADHVIITLADEGLLVSGSEKTDAGKNIVNDRISALQSAAIDPAGAGDALLVTAAMALSAGGSIWEASYLGSLASAVQVSRVGNIPLRRAELIEVLSS